MYTFSLCILFGIVDCCQNHATQAVAVKIKTNARVLVNQAYFNCSLNIPRMMEAFVCVTGQVSVPAIEIPIALTGWHYFISLNFMSLYEQACKAYMQVRMHAHIYINRDLRTSKLGLSFITNVAAKQ